MRKLFAAFVITLSCALPVFAHAAIDSETTGLNTTARGAFGAESVGGENTLSFFVGNNIIKPVFGIVGLMFFVLMVYGGVTWMTASGDPKRVDKAKAILTTAVIGVVIVTASYVLTNALFNAILKGNIEGA